MRAKLQEPLSPLREAGELRQNLRPISWPPGWRIRWAVKGRAGAPRQTCKHSLLTTSQLADVATRKEHRKSFRVGSAQRETKPGLTEGRLLKARKGVQRSKSFERTFPPSRLEPAKVLGVCAGQRHSYRPPKGKTRKYSTAPTTNRDPRLLTTFHTASRQRATPQKAVARPTHHFTHFHLHYPTTSTASPPGQTLPSLLHG